MAIILGSGFHATTTALREHSSLPYASLPGFPRTNVAGHEGRAYIGYLGNSPVLVLSGRSHYYEGYSMSEVCYAVRVLAAYGIQDLLLTNAAGGLNPRWRPGDFMIATDHINLMGVNPLRDPIETGRSRFVDLSQAYDPELRRSLNFAAKRCGLKLRSGVYLAVSGPTYETPAEIRAFARLGADAVGMSTVPEVLVARELGIRTAALSCITNLAAGLSSSPISHSDVLETAHRVQAQGTFLITEFASAYAESVSSKS